MTQLDIPAACLCLSLLTAAPPARAQAQADPPPNYDPTLATAVGADENGMRRYVFVVLKTGPTRMPDGPQRDDMFKGHFANMKRLAAQGKLVLAGPFDGVDGWRGMFVFATTDIEEAKKLVASDPVIASGEMIAEFHKYYASAALMMVNEQHPRVAKKPF